MHGVPWRGVVMALVNLVSHLSFDLIRSYGSMIFGICRRVEPRKAGLRKHTHMEAFMRACWLSKGFLRE